jgi:hypothetical protein
MEASRRQTGHRKNVSKSVRIVETVPRYEAAWASCRAADGGGQRKRKPRLEFAVDLLFNKNGEAIAIR